MVKSQPVLGRYYSRVNPLALPHITFLICYDFRESLESYG